MKSIVRKATAVGLAAAMAIGSMALSPVKGSQNVMSGNGDFETGTADEWNLSWDSATVSVNQYASNNTTNTLTLLWYEADTEVSASYTTGTLDAGIYKVSLDISGEKMNSGLKLSVNATDGDTEEADTTVDADIFVKK